MRKDGAGRIAFIIGDFNRQKKWLKSNSTKLFFGKKSSSLCIFITLGLALDQANSIVSSMLAIGDRLWVVIVADSHSTNNQYVAYGSTILCLSIRSKNKKKHRNSLG